MKILFAALYGFLLAGLLHAEEAKKPAFAGTINGHSVEIWMRYGKFKDSKRVVKWTTEKSKYDGKAESYKLYTINGHPICGTDNQRPRGDSDIIASITVVWDGEKQEISDKLFAHVVAPAEHGVLYSMDAKGEAVVVHLPAGDGGGSNAISWRFGKDKQAAMLKEPFFPVAN